MSFFSSTYSRVLASFHLELQEAGIRRSIEAYCNTRGKRAQEQAECGATVQEHLPLVLVLHLERGRVRGNALALGKIDTIVDFPLSDLDLAPFCRATNGPHQQGNNVFLYDLFGAVNHIGADGTAGHYITTARDWETEAGKLCGKWWRYNDDRVSLISTKEPKIDGSSVNLLFYKRRNV